MRAVLISSQKIACLFAILAFCGFFAACSGSDDSNTSSSASTVSAPASEQSGASSDGASSESVSSANSIAPNSIRVEFDSDGGSAVDDQYVPEGGFASQPPVPTRSAPAGLYTGTPPDAHDFLGWFTTDDQPWDFGADTVNEPLLLTAKWAPISGHIAEITPTDLDAAVLYVNDHAASGTSFTFVLDQDIEADTLTLSEEWVDLTLIGRGGERTIQYIGDPEDWFLNVGYDAPVAHLSLTLETNITLRGVPNGGRPNSSGYDLVSVRYGGALIMRAGARITGHNTGWGCAVCVGSGSSFLMTGGEITGNTNFNTSPLQFSMSGVHVDNGTFTMTGGRVQGNARAFMAWYSDDTSLDVFVEGDSARFVLSGSAEVGDVGLFKYNGEFPFITLNKSVPFTGSAFVDIIGLESPNTLRTGSAGKQLINAESGSLTPADIECFTLRTFLGRASNSWSKSDSTYTISTDGTLH